MTLFEKAPELGGQFRLAMAVPGKEDFADTLRYFTRRLEARRRRTPLDGGHGRRPRRLRPGRRRDRRAAPDAEIDGIDHPSVASYADVLSGAVVPGRRVAVIAPAASAST